MQADVKMARLLTFAKLGKNRTFETFFDNVMSKKTEKQEMKMAAIHISSFYVPDASNIFNGLNGLGELCEAQNEERVSAFLKLGIYNI